MKTKHLRHSITNEIEAKYDSHKHKYIQRSNVTDRKWHMNRKLRKYDIQQQNIV